MREAFREIDYEEIGAHCLALAPPARPGLADAEEQAGGAVYGCLCLHRPL
jgi:hypothetical protein